jgi:hypothetical protein
MAVCIAIICIGEKYIQEFKTLFYPSVSRYASKYGYDVKIFESFLDTNHATRDAISFQKCLTLSHPSMERYDQVLVLDADILIEDHAPAIPNTGDKIGIVNEASFSQYDKLKSVGFASYPTDYYKLCGFSISTDKILNTGMMICNPKKHGPVLKGIYDKYISGCEGHPRGFHYEQSCIGYELQTQHMFTCVSTYWNCIFVQYDILNTVCPKDNYFIHFAAFSGKFAEGIQRYQSARHGLKNSLRWGIHK